MDDLMWDLPLGAEADRSSIHARYGGRIHPRIAPSKVTPNILLFCDPAAMEAHGHICGLLDADGCLHVTGEGLEGDQPLRQGNASVLSHRQEGRALRVFFPAGNGRHRYAGQFEIDPLEPCYAADAPEQEADAIRTTVVLRLRPVGPVGPIPRTRLALGGAPIDRVAFAPEWTEQAFVAPDSRRGRIAGTAETLLAEYADHLLRLGHDATRLRILPPGERKPLIVPILDATDGTIVAARGTTSRAAVRAAVGELLDLKRFAGAEALALLLPGIPRPDLVAFVQSLGIALHCRDRWAGWITP